MIGRLVLAAALVVVASALDAGVKELHVPSSAKKWLSKPLYVDHNDALVPESVQTLLESAREQGKSIRMTPGHETPDTSPNNRKLLDRVLRLRSYACCQDLGFEDFRMSAGNDRVCAGLPVNTMCPIYKLSYANAVTACATIGAEVCTRTHFIEGEMDTYLSTNGCSGYASYNFWTNTDYTCDANGNTGYYTVKTSVSGPSDRQCRDETDANYFMCCSKNKRRTKNAEECGLAPTVPSTPGTPTPTPSPATPSPATPPATMWILASADDTNCNTVCTTNGMTCSAPETTLATVDDFIAIGTIYSSGDLTAMTVGSVCPNGYNALVGSIRPVLEVNSGVCYWSKTGGNTDYCTQGFATIKKYVG